MITRRITEGGYLEIKLFYWHNSDCSFNPGINLKNVGPFNNLLPDSYWIGVAVPFLITQTLMTIPLRTV